MGLVVLFLLLAAAALISEVVGAFELFPSKLKLYDDARAFTLHGNGLKSTSRVRFHPSEFNDRVRQTVNAEEQSITIYLLLLNNTESRLGLPPPPLIYVWVSPTQRVLVAETFPRPRLFPLLTAARVHPVELSVTLQGENLAPKHLGELEFSLPQVDYQYTANSTSLTIYFSTTTTSGGDKEAAPDSIKLLAIHGPAGRVPVHQIDIHGLADVDDDDAAPPPQIVSPPEHHLPEVYQTGIHALKLYGRGGGGGGGGELVIGFKHAHVVQFQDFDLVPAAHDEDDDEAGWMVYPKPTTFIEWTASGQSTSLLVINMVNGLAVKDTVVGLVRPTPMVFRDLNQQCYYYYHHGGSVMRVRGTAFVPHHTRLGISLRPNEEGEEEEGTNSAAMVVVVDLEQDVDFTVFVESSEELIVTWLAGVGTDRAAPGTSWTGVVTVEWIQIGRAPRLDYKMQVAQLVIVVARGLESSSSSSSSSNASTAMMRIYQTHTSDVVLTLPFVGPLDAAFAVACELTLHSSTGLTERTIRVTQATAKRTAVVGGDLMLTISAVTVSATVASSSSSTRKAASASAASALVWASAVGDVFLTSINKRQQQPSTGGIPLGLIVQPVPVIDPGAGTLRVCHSHTRTFTIRARHIPLQSRVVFSPAEFRVLPDFRRERNDNDRDGAGGYYLTFTRAMDDDDDAAPRGLLPTPISIVFVDAGAGPVTMNKRIGMWVEDGDGRCLRDDNAPSSLCADTCGAALVRDGVCDDGRPGAGSALCAACTDCSDCGPCEVNQ